MSSVEDPFGQAQRVAGQWAVTEKLLIGVRSPSANKIEVATANAIRAGDLLEVTFVFDLARQGNQTPRCNIRFWMRQVVKLCSSKNLPRIQVSWGLYIGNAVDSLIGT